GRAAVAHLVDVHGMLRVWLKSLGEKENPDLVVAGLLERRLADGLAARGGLELRGGPGRILRGGLAAGQKGCGDGHGKQWFVHSYPPAPHSISDSAPWHPPNRPCFSCSSQPRDPAPWPGPRPPWPSRRPPFAPRRPS